MKGRYATAAAFKNALEQRLRSRAGGDGHELQRLRQLVVFDRFLARLFAELGHAAVETVRVSFGLTRRRAG